MALVAVALLIVAAAGGWSSRFGLDDSIERIIRAGALLIALSMGLWLFRQSRKVALAETATGQRPYAEMAPKRLEIPKLSALQKDAVSLAQDAPRAVGLFAEMVTEPEKYRKRAAETIDLGERALRQSVSVELSLRGAGTFGQYLYVPVLQPLKGELIDHFHIRDGSGKSLVDLTYDETIKLAAAGLRLLIVQAMENQGRPPSPMPEEVRVIELALLDVIARRGSADEPTISVPVARAVKELVAQIGGVNDKSRIEKYVLKMGMSYPIVAVVPSASLVDSRTLLSYSRTVVPVSHRPGWRGTLRLGLGLRPYQVALPVALAFTAGSYHMRVNGPRGTYLYGRYLRCKHCRFLVTSKWGSSTEPPEGDCSHKDEVAPQIVDRHYRVRQRRGQDFVHVYMRGYANKFANLTGLELIARFKEIPPGARARALVTALGATVLIGIIGNRVSPEGAATVSDMTALVMAAPVVASTWFGGLLGDGDSFAGQSLLGRLSLIITGITSLVAVVVYYDPAGLVGGLNAWGGISLLGITNPVWGLLFLIAAVNLIYVSYRFILRLSFYASLLRKPEPLGVTASLD